MAPPLSKRCKCNQLCNPIVLLVMYDSNEATKAKVIAYWTSI